jgi:hypothetical protein
MVHSVFSEKLESHPITGDSGFMYYVVHFLPILSHHLQQVEQEKSIFASFVHYLHAILMPPATGPMHVVGIRVVAVRMSMLARISKFRKHMLSPSKDEC